MTVKPSRGTVIFFGLLAVALFARYANNRREDSIVARDAPLAHSTRRLLRCAIGRDAERMLWPRPSDDDPRPWAAKLNTHLRRVVSEPQGDSWPSRCVSLAQRVAAKLASTPNATAAHSAAAEVVRHLESLALSPTSAITVAENGRLGTALATLTIEVIKSTVGTESGWQSPLAHEATDLYPVRVARIPQGNTITPRADGATFAAPEWVLYQDANDRRAHSLLFRERGAPADAVLGAGAPLRVTNAAAAMLATDEADALLPLEAVRSAPLQLPASVRTGEHIIESWQYAKSAGHRWFAYISRGRLHVWSTPANGAVSWVERVPATLQDTPVAAVALVATPESPEGQPTSADSGVVINAEPTANAAAADATSFGVRAYLLRHGARGMSVEAWSFARPSEGSETPVARPAPQTGAAPREMVTRQVLVTEGRPLSRARVRACVAGNTAHFVAASDDDYAFYRLDANGAVNGDIPTARVGALSAGRFEFSCDEQRSLLLADAVGHSGAMLEYVGGREPRLLPTPLPSLAVQRTIDAAALVPGAVLAFVRTPGSVRVFSTTDSNTWVGGAPLAILEVATSPPPEQPEAPVNPGFAFSISAVSTFRERVGVLGVGRGSVIRAVRLFSTDSGRTWN
jgi:hypothetical protein